MPEISVIVPNWNGQPFIARCLAGVLHSARISGLSYEIIVIDDASSDGSAEIVSGDFPQVRLIRNQANMGFGASVNRAAKEAAGTILLLLNNDLVPRDAMVAQLAGPMINDTKLFGVSGKTVDWKAGNANHLCMAAKWNNGQFAITHSDPAQLSPTMFLQGGCSAVRRAEFLQLGGFCHLFAPGYWEDYDLSYLALKSGWKNLYNPKAVAYHFGQGSMVRAFGADYLSSVRMRNYYYFAWLNLTDHELLNEHLRQLPGTIAKGLAFSGDVRNQLKGLVKAFAGIVAITNERNRRREFMLISDKLILDEFAKHEKPT